MRFYDMKKITLIASLLIVFTACQKADIRPRTVSSESSTEELKSISSSSDTQDPNGGNSNALGGGTDPSVDPPTDPNGGDITDPLRKKDQKDNK